MVGGEKEALAKERIELGKAEGGSRTTRTHKEARAAMLLSVAHER